MLKIGPIITGIILVILLKLLVAPYPYDIIWLIVIGFVIGYMVGAGAMNGLINSAIAGTIGGIGGTLMFVFMSPYTNFQSFILHELSSLTIMAALTALLYQLAYFCLIMGISGAIGGTLNKGRKKG